MTEQNKDFKIVFAPGCFDSFEGTQEELDGLVAEIQKMFEGKTREEIESMSDRLTDEELDELPEDVQAQILNALDDEEIENKRKNLQ